MEPNFPPGKCQCGCGGDTNTNPKTKQPYRFMRGHGTRAVTLSDGRRLCKYCGEAKPLEDFVARRRDRGPKHADERDNRCKTCYAANQRQYYAAKREQYWRAARNRSLQRKYGITLDEYEAMLAEQNGRCLLCGRAENLVLDHCHNTQTVRGIICKPCNTGIGFLGENAETLFRAAHYLAKGNRT